MTPPAQQEPGDRFSFAELAAPTIASALVRLHSGSGYLPFTRAIRTNTPSHPIPMTCARARSARSQPIDSECAAGLRRSSSPRSSSSSIQPLHTRPLRPARRRASNRDHSTASDTALVTAPARTTSSGAEGISSATSATWCPSCRGRSTTCRSTVSPQRSFKPALDAPGRSHQPGVLPPRTQAPPGPRPP